MEEAAVAVAFVLGLGTAFVWVWRFFAVERRRAGAAAIWDGATMFLAYVPLQLWANAENDFLVLVSFVVGNMVGTYFTVRWGR